MVTIKICHLILNHLIIFVDQGSWGTRMLHNKIPEKSALTHLSGHVVGRMFLTTLEMFANGFRRQGDLTIRTRAILIRPDPARPSERGDRGGGREAQCHAQTDDFIRTCEGRHDVSTRRGRMSSVGHNPIQPAA